MENKVLVPIFVGAVEDEADLLPTDIYLTDFADGNNCFELYKDGLDGSLKIVPCYKFNEPEMEIIFHSEWGEDYEVSLEEQINEDAYYLPFNYGYGA